MDPARVTSILDAVGPRGACSDGERRAAKALSAQLRALGRSPRTETHWIRPQWPAVWLTLAIAGVGASVASVGIPAIALGVLAAVALIALLELRAIPTLALLWPRRATQNVVAQGPGTAPVRLIITAAYDAPRRRPVLGAPLARADRAVRRATRGAWPAPLALLALSLTVLAGCAGARLGGVDAPWLGLVQLVPTIACIAATALLAELALSPPSDGPNLSTSAPAVALALVDALDRRPPRRLEVDVVFAGAGDALAAGLRRHVRARRKSTRPEHIAVLHLEPCGAGRPRAWRRDGPLFGLRLHPQLLRAAEDAGFAPHTGRDTTGALIARRARWPAVAVGRLDATDAAPSELDPAALQDTVDRCIELVRRLDAQVPGRSS